MRRTFVAVVSLVLVVSAMPPTTATAESTPWDGASTMLGGTSTRDVDEWIHQDFVYDDYGADTQASGATQIVSLAATSGDFRYPTAPRYGRNAADIAEVRVRPSGDDLSVRVTMNTLIEDGTTVLGVAIDELVHIPEDPGTAWPFAAGVRSVWDRFVTVADGDVHLTDASGTTIIGSPAVDLSENTIDFTIPDVGDGIGLVVGAGLWDTGAGEWLAGASGNSPSEETYSTGGAADARLFDLAFNTHRDEPRAANWMEDAQSDALAAGDVRRFDAQLRIDDLRDPDRPIIELSTRGFHNGIFRSRQTHLAEGVNPGGFPQFNGLYQPYGIWLPSSYRSSKPMPLVLLLHSLSVHHNQYAGEGATDSYRTLYEQFEDGLDAIVVTPLGRGPDGWYWDEALVDTFEVWQDVRTKHAIDDDRTYVGGYSMGGYGTYRLTTLMPDRFASAAVWVGPPAHQLWAYPAPPTPSGSRQAPGNTYDQLESVQHVPTYIVHGTNDELVPVTGVVHQAERFRALGYEHRFALHPGQDHLSFVFVDSWTRERDWLVAHPQRVTAPANVTFDVRPASWVTPGRADAGVILGHISDLVGELDSAYWVRDVEVAEGDDVTGEVDLTSHAIAARDPAVSELTEAHPGLTEERPTTPYLLRGADRTYADAGTEDVLSGSLSGVTELTVDLERAGFTSFPVLDVATDGPVTIHLVLGSTTQTVVIGGA